MRKSKDMRIYVDNRQTDIPIDKKAIKTLVKTMISLEKVPCNEISIHFVNAKEISALHHKFFGIPLPTDCISFPIENQEEDYQLLGDVFVCTRVAVDYAAQNDKDPYREATLYVVHGVLHLLGYDDIEDGDRAAMRAAEKRYMALLKRRDLWIKNPEGAS